MKTETRPQLGNDRARSKLSTKRRSWMHLFSVGNLNNENKKKKAQLEKLAKNSLTLSLFLDI